MVAHLVFFNRIKKISGIAQSQNNTQPVSPTSQLMHASSVCWPRESSKFPSLSNGNARVVTSTKDSPQIKQCCSLEEVQRNLRELKTSSEILGRCLRYMFRYKIRSGLVSCVSRCYGGLCHCIGPSHCACLIEHPLPTELFTKHVTFIIVFNPHGSPKGQVVTLSFG